MYSQNQEEKYILEYFSGNTKGKFIEIGGFHPFIFSNTRALVELGWIGIVVEPSPKCIVNFRDEYKSNQQITLIEAAVTDRDGIIDFFEEGHGHAVGSIDIAHKEKWEADSNFNFNKIQVKSISMSNLLRFYGNNVDFISIDVEGTNYELFKLIPDSFFERLKCICIEHDNYNKEIIEKLTPFGFKEVYFNGENIIMVKK